MNLYLQADVNTQTPRGTDVDNPEKRYTEYNEFIYDLKSLGYVSSEMLFALHRFVCEKNYEILKCKNRDYSNAVYLKSDALKNFKIVKHSGLCEMSTGVMVRLCDKMQRLTSLLLADAPSVKSESLNDTIGDAINYLVILQAVLEYERYTESTRGDDQ
jgi:hypothetical protein